MFNVIVMLSRFVLKAFSLLMELLEQIVRVSWRTEYTPLYLILFASDLAAERDLRKSALVDVVDDCKKSCWEKGQGVWTLVLSDRLTAALVSTSIPLSLNDLTDPVSSVKLPSGVRWNS